MQLLLETVQQITAVAVMEEMAAAAVAVVDPAPVQRTDIHGKVPAVLVALEALAELVPLAASSSITASRKLSPLDLS